MPSAPTQPVRRTLLALVTCTLIAACSGDDSVSPRKPASVTAAASLGATATVGTAISAGPAVKVVDDKGAPVSGVSVQFAITGGGGSLANTSAATDASGMASAGAWTLGTLAGANTATATVAGVAPVQFTVTGMAATAATIAVSAGDAQSAAVGTSIATAPAVIVKDQYGNAVGNAAVTFSVVAGGGTLTGATATTGSDGVARAGSWTLGISTGAQQLRATTGTLTTTINATATVTAGCSITNYALGASLGLAWDANDCVSNGVAGASVAGRRYDRLQFTTTAQEQVDAAVTGANGRALLLRNAVTGLYVGLQPGTAFSPATQNPMHHKYVLAPGSYVYEPYAPDANTTGAYSISTTTRTTVNCDYIVFATTNVTIADSITNTNYNCAGPGGAVEQWVNLQLKTGTKVRITLSNSEFVPILLFRDDRLGPASPTLVSKRGTTVGETLVIDWTATFDTWHEIIVVPTAGKPGKYTLKIEELP